MSRWFPPARWLREYRAEWLRGDIVAGATLAAYAIPVALAYASLAGLPPQVGVYGYLLGGLGYALLGSSRQLAVGPTSAISLMIAGTVGAMAGGDAERYMQVASLAAFTVAALCLIAWLLRLSVLVKLVSDSVLVGFKIGAGLTIAMTQLPSLLGIAGGGHDFLERLWLLVTRLGPDQPWWLRSGPRRSACFWAERGFPGKPVRSPSWCWPSLLRPCWDCLHWRFRSPAGFRPACHPSTARRCGCAMSKASLPLAAGCLLLAYIESVSAARTFAAKHGYPLDPRQEFLGLGAANFAAALGHGYPVAGGLSQSAVNDQAGARTPLALVFASIALAFCLLFLTGFLENLPKAVLAAIVLTAILGLFDFAALRHMWRVSPLDFRAATTALIAVLLLGILQGILFAALASIVLLLFRASTPHVAFLGRVPGTNRYSDMARHPENEALQGVIAFRPEASLLYFNADFVLDQVLGRIRTLSQDGLHRVICDLSASPHLDLAGCRILHELQGELSARGVALRIVGAHGAVRDLLRADGLEERTGVINRHVTLESLLEENAAAPTGPGRRAD